MDYDWNFRILLNPAYRAALLHGLLVTLQLTGWCVIIGTPLGVALGVLGSLGQMPFDPAAAPTAPGLGWRWGLALRGVLPQRWLRAGVRAAVLVAIDVIRAIPLLLLILTSYYALPIVVEGRLAQRLFQILGAEHPFKASGFLCAMVAMSVNLAAFIADLVRGAARGVSRGSILAARALGMGSWLTWRRIVLPEILREILPGLILLYITMLKMSTLASVVAVYELLHTAESIIQETYKPLELYLAVCGLFVAVVVPLSMLGRGLEHTRYFKRRSQA